MLCADVMKPEVECTSPEDPVENAARQMKDQNVGFLPVCDESDRIVGVITDRDIALRVVAEGLPATTAVEEVMTQEVVACEPTDDIRRAEQLMAENRKSRVLCIDDRGFLVGVISLSDIAKRDGARIAQTMQEVTRREAHS